MLPPAAPAISWMMMPTIPPDIGRYPAFAL
jgi:hypothetical protein